MKIPHNHHDNQVEGNGGNPVSMPPIANVGKDEADDDAAHHVESAEEVVTRQRSQTVLLDAFRHADDAIVIAWLAGAFFATARAGRFWQIKLPLPVAVPFL